MGTYNLPRNVKGEGRILFIFTGKSIVWTVVGGAIGFIFYLVFSALNMATVGLIIIGVFALIGFAISTFKVPNIAKIDFTKQTGGENIDDIIRRAIKFRMRGKKIYIYKEEETNAK